MFLILRQRRNTLKKCTNLLGLYRQSGNYIRVHGIYSEVLPSRCFIKAPCEGDVSIFQESRGCAPPGGSPVYAILPGNRDGRELTVSARRLAKFLSIACTENQFTMWRNMLAATLNTCCVLIDVCKRLIFYKRHIT